MPCALLGYACGPARGSLLRSLLAFARDRIFPGASPARASEAALAGLLWSKGIARLCDVHGPAEYPFAPTESWQGDAFFGQHFAGARGTVWVRLSTRSRDGLPCDLDSFVEAALPLIREPFCLLTTDGDTAVPSQLRPRTATALLESPFLRAWYTQNHDGFAHPKLRPFPIGLDLHTPRPEGGAAELAGLLRDLRDRRAKLSTARVQVFCDLRVSRSSLERSEAIAALRNNRYVDMPKRRLSQKALWQRYASYPFVLSAAGSGLDCHRTYEALYLGCIVIMKRSPIASLFEGLPVAFVESWAAAGDPANLRRWLAELAPLAARDNVERRLDPRRWIEALASGCES